MALYSTFVYTLLRRHTRLFHSLSLALSSLAILVGGSGCTEDSADIVFGIDECEVFDNVREWLNIDPREESPGTLLVNPDGKTEKNGLIDCGESNFFWLQTCQ